MLVSYYDFPSNDECGICRESMKGEDSVAHSGIGKKHPLHKNCLKTWLQTKNECPFCKERVELNSLLTWKERIVRELRLMKHDALALALPALIAETVTDISAAALRRWNVPAAFRGDTGVSATRIIVVTAAIIVSSVLANATIRKLEERKLITFAS